MSMASHFRSLQELPPWGEISGAGYSPAGHEGHLLDTTKPHALTLRNSRNGTNCTMSRAASSPVYDRSTRLSPSRNSMAAKSAFPTPMMMMDIGSLEACTTACLVSSMSLMTPSVMIRRMKYCCGHRAESHIQHGTGSRKWTCVLHFTQLLPAKDSF